MAVGHRIEDAEGLRESGNGKALLVRAPEFDEDEWIPQSQIHDDSEVWREGDEGVLIVTEWLARQRGWV